MIESSMFIVNLVDESPVTLSERGRSGLYGIGSDRWCDKSFSILVYENGRSTVHAEHSWGDGRYKYNIEFHNSADVF